MLNFCPPEAEASCATFCKVAFAVHLYGNNCLSPRWPTLVKEVPPQADRRKWRTGVRIRWIKSAFPSSDVCILHQVHLVSRGGLRFQFLMSFKTRNGRIAHYSACCRENTHELQIGLAYILSLYIITIYVFDRQIISFYMIMSFQIRTILEQKGWQLAKM